MKRFTSHLSYRWWMYLIATVVILFVWITIFQVLAKPAPDECVRILYVGEYWDTESIENAIFDHLSHHSAQRILEVKVDFFTGKTSTFLPMLMAKQYEYDLILISKPSMQENIGQNAFLLPVAQSLQPLTPDAVCYTEVVEGTEYTYAFQITGKPAESRFASFHAEECYLFISPHSVNCDQLNGQGQPGHDAAIKTILYLLETP